MKELIITKEELAVMFNNGELKDTSNGWLFNDKIVEIIALHETEPKYIKDITKAQKYKLVFK
jgi:hypothetical protein